MDWTPIRRGIRQGAPSSPILFSTYMYDFPQRSIRVAGEDVDATRLYADDIAILCPSLCDLCEAISQVRSWCAANAFSLNIDPDKTAIMRFTSAEEECPRAVMGIPVVSSYCYLGMQLKLRSDDRFFARARSVAQLRKRINCLSLVTPLLCRLIRAASTSSLGDAVSLIHSVFRGNLYGCVGLTPTQKRGRYATGTASRLEIMLRSTIRALFHAPRSSPTSDLHSASGVFPAGLLLHFELISFASTLLKHTGANSPPSEQHLMQVITNSAEPSIEAILNSLIATSPDAVTSAALLLHSEGTTLPLIPPSTPLVVARYLFATRDNAAPLHRHLSQEETCPICSYRLTPDHLSSHLPPGWMSYGSLETALLALQVLRKLPLTTDTFTKALLFQQILRNLH